MGNSQRPLTYDDLVQREFVADTPNRLWLPDITEHQTAEGKLYLRAIEDVFSNRVVGYSIDSRMKSRLAVAALNNAVAWRRNVAGCIHQLNPVNFVPGNSFVHSTATTWSS